LIREGTYVRGTDERMGIGMKKNPNYISIGKVSKEKNVTIKALRYYDSIGVFKPAYVDKVTNYRYYDKNKLYILDAILLCVELGMSLKKFEKYKMDDGEFDLRQLLYDGKSHGEQKIADIRKRLGTLSKTIARIEGDTTFTAEESVSRDKNKAIAKKTEEESLQGIKIEEEQTSAKALVEKPSVEMTSTKAFAEKTSVENQPERDIAEDTNCEESHVDTAVNEDAKARLWEKKQLQTRGILTSPLEGGAADSKKILRLNMVAQLLGMTASYPAGRLYDYDAQGKVTGYAYILVEGYENCEDKRLRVIPEGTYNCRQGQKIAENNIAAATEYVVKDHRNVTIIETDMLGSDKVELQVLSDYEK